MCAIWFIPNSLARRPGVAVLTAILVCAGTVLAERFPPDPVEELRLALRTPGLEPTLLNQRVQALRSLADIRRALGLQEWRLEADGTNTRLYALLADRFKTEARRLLKSGTADARLAVSDMLAEMGPGLRGPDDPKGLARALAPDLADLVKNGDTPRIRAAAARALGLIFPDPNVAVPPLRDLLASPVSAERRAAVNALVNLVRVANMSKSTGVAIADRGDVAQLGTAILPLAGLGLTNPDPAVRRLAAEATEQAAEALYSQVPQLRTAEETVDPLAERQGLESARSQLMPLMEAFKQQEAVLTKALHDSDVQVRLLIQRALEDLGYARLQLYRAVTPHAAPAGVPEPGAAGAAARPGAEPVAVTNQDQPASLPDPLFQTLRTALSVLAANVADPDVRVRLGAIDTLEAMGMAAAPAAPALVQALPDPHRFVRWAAARTLGKMSPVQSAAAVPAIGRLLFDEDRDVCLSAAVALDRYGPAAEAAVPDLIRATKASDADVRVAAIRTLEGIGTGAQPAVPALAAALSDPDGRVRRTAAEVLGRFGSLAASAEPALRRALDDPDSDVSKAASDALLSILPAEK